jgi:heme-degrading monooxygenase HmoA
MSVFDTCRQVHAPDPNPSRRVFVATSLASGLALAVQPVFAADQERSLQMEITISSNREVATLINVFVVEPDNQDKLIQVLKERTEALFSKQPGYISASFHKSMDGRRVVNYGQWRSPKDIDAFRSKPEISEYFKRVKELAQFESMVCDVSYVNRA